MGHASRPARSAGEQHGLNCASIRASGCLVQDSRLSHAFRRAARSAPSAPIVNELRSLAAGAFALVVESETLFLSAWLMGLPFYRGQAVAQAAAQIAGVSKVSHLEHGLAEDVAAQVLSIASNCSHIPPRAAPGSLRRRRAGNRQNKHDSHGRTID